MNKWPHHTSEEIKLVKKILASGKTNYLYGEYGKKFEKLFSKIIGNKYSIAVANGTIALEIAIKALNLPKKSEILVPSRSFFASASSVVQAGHTPVFTDVDYNSQNINLKYIKESITNKTKAILCVHLAGFPCDMFEISNFAKKNKLFIVEDCSQAHGAKIKNRSIGSFGDISCWSFCFDKIISTGGEGGIISTNSKIFFEYIWSYKDHGKNIYKYNKKTKLNKFRYIHDSFGTNGRLTEMQSAIGLLQISKLDVNIIKRNNICNFIINSFKDFNFIKFQKVPDKYLHSYYKLYFYIDFKLFKKNIKGNDLLYEFQNKKLKINSGSCPEIYLEKAFINYKNRKNRFNNAKLLGLNSFAISIHHKMIKKDLIKITKSMKAIFRKYV